VWQNGCAVSVQANLSETKVMPELIQECVVLAGNQGCPFNFNYNELDYYEASLLVMTGLEAGDNVAGNIRHVIVVGATDSVARISLSLRTSRRRVWQSRTKIVMSRFAPECNELDYHEASLLVMTGLEAKVYNPVSFQRRGFLLKNNQNLCHGACLDNKGREIYHAYTAFLQGFAHKIAA